MTTILDAPGRVAIVPGLDDDTYHADPAFSQSAAKVLLDSPAKYRYQLDHPEPPKKAYDEGLAVHAKVLGVGLPIVIIPDELLAANRAISTKAAKTFVDEARAAGQVPLKSDEAARIDAMAEAILAKRQARILLELDGEIEASMWWVDAATGVQCRGRFDKLVQTPDGVLNVDVKKTHDASARGFAKSCADFGYHVQAAAYDDGYRHVTGGDDAPTVLIAVEDTAPHLVALWEFSAADLDKGLAKWRRALDLLVECRARDEWPGYPDDIQTLRLPHYA